VYRAGFRPTRSAARQAAAHGHFTVNGRRVTVPSYRLSTNDVVAIREGSKETSLFTDLTETVKNRASVSWLAPDVSAMTITVTGTPELDASELLFDIQSVIEFYSR